MKKQMIKIKALSLILCSFMATALLSGCSGKLSTTNSSNSYKKDQISTETLNANTGFAFDIFRQLDKEDGSENIFISPLSISTALTMTYQGAGTSTKEAMARALGYYGLDDAKLNESYKNLIKYLRQLDKKVELNISNSLWIKEGQSIREDFISVNRDVFDASVTSMDFSKENAADEINKWISNATKKKIEKMIDPPISPDIIMFLINAIYFKGDWKDKFDTKNTIDASFHAGNGNIDEVKMMSRFGTVEYGQGDGFKAVRLPYGTGKAAMYCILPGEQVSVGDFIAGMDNEKWTVIKDSISEKKDVRLQLPRFKLEYGIKNLNESLTALGMGEAFTDSADFSGIRDNLCISRVLHKAVIEVNEEGSEAAGVTVVEMRETAYAEPLTFIADRPFVFIIADDDTGSILFIGKVYNI